MTNLMRQLDRYVGLGFRPSALEIGGAKSPLSFTTQASKQVGKYGSKQGPTDSSPLHRHVGFERIMAMLAIATATSVDMNTSPLEAD